MSGGRPRVYVRRTLEEFPAPTPLPTRGLCRLWQGAVDRDGYGYLTANHHRVAAHRWVWEMANGPIPWHKVVRHRCDNRLCFRLSHLQLGTVAQNNDDIRRAGRLGPPPKITPSQAEAIFVGRDNGLTYAEIHQLMPDLSLATVKRVGKIGREGFKEKYG